MKMAVFGARATIAPDNSCGCWKIGASRSPAITSITQAAGSTLPPLRSCSKRSAFAADKCHKQLYGRVQPQGGPAPKKIEESAIPLRAN